MKRFLIAAVTCLALTVGVTPAMAGSGLGDVTGTLLGTSQQNTHTAGDASASNENGTWQSNDQSQQGYGGDATTGDATTGAAGCCASAGDATSGDAYGGDVTQSQEAANSNSTTQGASAESKAVQILPVNVAVPVCIAKRCETGDVRQSNTNRSGDASASNENGTWQSNGQSQQGYGGEASTGDATTGKGGCCGSAGDATSGDAYGGDVTQSQSASNSNDTSQDASADSKAKQIAPVNVSGANDARQSNGNSSGDAWAGNERDAQPRARRVPSRSGTASTDRTSTLEAVTAGSRRRAHSSSPCSRCPRQQSRHYRRSPTLPSRHRLYPRRRSRHRR